jgi:dihydroorotate dehydrogenase (fumarate)
VRIPLAVKLVPFYSSLPHFAGQLDRLGADGLVIFNRSYAPDVDPATLRPRRSVPLSARSELALRVRWLAILRGHIRGALAVTGGVYTGVDAAKAILAGADAVQLVSALLRYGPSHLRHVRRQLDEWGDAHGFASIQDMRGRASLDRQKASDLFTRGHYVRLLQSEHQGV